MTTASPRLPPVPEAALVAYCEELAHLYEQAYRQVPHSQYSERTLIMGTCVLRVSSPDSDLLDKLTRALSHLPTSQAEPDLTICVWAGDPVPPSPLAWYARQFGDDAAQRLQTSPLDARGELPQFNAERIRTAIHVYPSKLTLLDMSRKTAYCWMSSVDAVPYYQQSAPFQDVFSWWMNRQGQTIVHASAVGLDDGGVLFIGNNGAGKSTSALACLASPLGYAGDDSCLVINIPAPRVYSLYNSAKLRTQIDLDRFPELASHVHNADALDHEKALMFIQDAYPQKIVLTFPLRALIIPRVTGEVQPRLQPATPHQVLQAIAPSSVSQQPGSARRVFAEMAQIAQRVPGYTLDVGDDVNYIPQLVLMLLRNQGAAQ